MNNFKISELDDDSFMIDDPIGYNDALFGFFREKYALPIDKIFIDLEEREKYEQWLKETSPLKNRLILERHLFPIFASASHSGGLHSYHLEFGSAFIRAISIPLLRIDNRIDRTPLEVTKADTLNFCSLKNNVIDFCLFNEGYRDMSRLPNATKIMNLVSSNYLRIFSSLYFEVICRYNLNNLIYPKHFLKSIFNSDYSPLTCMYFSTTVQASILLNSGLIEPELKRVTGYFGKLRQICDQISDVEEDIIIGNITMPVLFALIHDSDKKLETCIKFLWNDIQKSEAGIADKTIISEKAKEIKEITQTLDGFGKTYQLAEKLYLQAMNLFFKYKDKTSMSRELALLFRAKRAYLERLKSNNWLDIPNYY